MSRPWTFRALCTSVLIVIILAIAALGVSIWRHRTKDLADGVRHARNVAVLLGGQIARSIQSVDIILRGLQSRMEQIDNLTKFGGASHGGSAYLHKTLVEQRSALVQALHIVVANDRGQVIATTAAWPTPHFNIADREYFRELATADDDRLSISLPVGNRASGEPVIVLARRINGPDREFLGVVLISVATTYFENIYRAVDALPEQTFLLLRRDGTIIVLYPHGLGTSGQKIGALGPFLKAVANGGGSYRLTSPFDHKIRWAAAVPLADYPLAVNSGIPEDVLLADWRSQAMLTIIATLLFLTCALALLWIMARQYRNLSASEASLAEKSQALESEHAHFNAALNNMNQGLAMFDGEARLVVCNERYRQMHRLSPDQAKVGLPLREILAHRHRFSGFPANVDDYFTRVRDMVASRNLVAQEFDHVDGRVFAVKRDPMPGGGWVATFDDVTDRRAGEVKIRHLAHNDLLTGLANRPQLLEQLGQAQERLREAGQPFTVLMLDLDRFNLDYALG